jgi:hypothetical protein
MLRRVRVTIVAVEKQMYYSECVSVALVIQRANSIFFTHHIVTCGLSDSTP